MTAFKRILAVCLAVSLVPFAGLIQAVAEVGDSQVAAEDIRPMPTVQTNAFIDGSFDLPQPLSGVVGEYSAVGGTGDYAEVIDYIHGQMLLRADEINIYSYNIPVEDFTSLYEKVLNTYADLFFIGVNINGTESGGYIYSYIPEYSYEQQEIEEMMADFNSAVKEITDVIDNENMTDLEIAVYVHDRLAYMAEYDYENYIEGAVPRISHTAYGILVNKVGVCQGYAGAYKHILNLYDIECEPVTSKVLNHMWNIVKLNGEYYHVDITWDDPVEPEADGYYDILGRVTHNYLLRTSEYMAGEGGHVGGEGEEDWLAHEIVEDEATDWVAEGIADDTTYEGYYWENVTTPFFPINGYWYYSEGNYTPANYTVTTTINKRDTLLPNADKTTLKSFTDKWFSWGTSSFYTASYTRLAPYGEELLYYSTPTEIRCMNIDGTEDTTAEIRKSEDGYIYSMSIEGDTLTYRLAEQEGEPPVGTYTLTLTAPANPLNTTAELQSAIDQADGTPLQPTVIEIEASFNLVSTVTVPGDKGIELDLKGYTLTLTEEDVNAFEIETGGYLLLKDTSSEKTGLLITHMSDSENVIINNAGTFVIESGEIKAENGTSNTAVLSSGIMTINGGEIEAEGANATAVSSSGDVTLTEGNISADGTAAASGIKLVKAADEDTPSLAMTGGSITASGNSTDCTAVALYAGEFIMDGGTVTGGCYGIENRTSGFPVLKTGTVSGTTLALASKTSPAAAVAGQFKNTVSGSKFLSTGATQILEGVAQVTHTKGDVNGDGNISAVDALMILQISAGIFDDYQSWQISYGNVDDSGDKPGPLDALKVLQYAAGLIPSFS